MNTIPLNKIGWTFALCFIVTGLGGCKKDFSEMNTDSESTTTVSPESLFYTAQTQMLTSASFWYDTYACKLRWMQYCSNIWGYSTTNFTYFSSQIGSGIYTEYNDVGSYITSAVYQADQQGVTDKYSNMAQMCKILIITKGMQASDIQGSLAYSTAWKVRAGNDSSQYLTPSFQSQEELYNTWNEELKTCVDNLKNPPADSKAIGQYDRAFGGNIAQWIKTANALRLRIAIRLLKRLPDLATQIATEVLAANNSAYVPNGIDDSFILWHANDYTTYNSGDWHSIYDMDCAAGPFMRYLNKYDDPRKRIFFQINNLTTANIAAYNAQPDDKKVGGDITSAMTQWEGGTVSYDKRSTDEPYLARTLYSSPSIDMRAMNYPQTRIWKGTGYDGTGTGGNFVPLLSYSDFCFMAAEFVFRFSIPSTQSAEQWYTAGVTASVTQWDKLGDYCKVYDYQQLTDNELQTFLAQPDIAWNEAMGLEQIYCQAYVEDFKNVNESWSQWKRTAYPNTNTSIITFDDVLINGVTQEVPRKVRFTYPTEGTTNYDNVKARLDEMASYPEFGGVNDEFGHLWWEN